MKKTSILMAIAMAALAAAVLLSSCATAGASAKSELSCRIEVQGEARLTAKPDIVEFSVAVSELAPTTSEAQQMANAKISRILEVLKSFGLDDRNISTSNLTFNTEYSWTDSGRNFLGERVSQRVTARMKELASFPALVDALGANLTGISLDSVSFDLQDKTQLYAQARTLAIAHASEKAQTYAAASGLALGKAVSISEGGVYISRGNAKYGAAMAAEAASADGYSTEIPSGEIEISASVNIVFSAD
ncbi:MAG: SIMPL domain-containing protein [Sphaerochaetaceae bacterium]